jgi:hypothetical protein
VRLLISARALLKSMLCGKYCSKSVLSEELLTVRKAKRDAGPEHVGDGKFG